MREAGLMVSKTHRYLKNYIKPGITTKELDELAEKYILSMGGVPSCKGYEGFPATLCTSINDEVVHGIPSPRKLKKGDIIKVDGRVERRKDFDIIASNIINIKEIV